MARPARSKPRREPLYLRVVKGGFEPASAYYADMLRAKGLRIGDLVRIDMSKPRYPRHHRLVMALLQKVLENQEGLLTMSQLLTVVKIKLGYAEPFVDAVAGKTYWVPQSIAFDAMDQTEFEVFWKDLCKLVTRDYFPGMSEAQVADLANMMDPA